ncbi:MAG: N-acetyltransferase [Bacteroidota bacterium]
MEVQIRQEEISDYTEVASTIELAFQNEPLSDHQEHFLVERLRQASDFIPELSLVALVEGQIVGHIIFSKILIQGATSLTTALALAPVSVRPGFQGQGIGSCLIEAGHEIARQLGFGSVILLGHADYYPRFGYVPTTEFDIELPFPAPPENCLALELQPGALKNASRRVVYPPVFFA